MRAGRLRLIAVAAALSLSLCSCGGHEISRTDRELTLSSAVTSSAEESLSSQAETSAGVSSASETVTESLTEISSAEEITSEQDAAAEKTKAEQAFEKMSLREKVGQLFIFRFDEMLYNDSDEHFLQYLDDSFKSCVESYPVGGFLTMGANISSGEQLMEMNRAVNEMYPTVKPFICTDEEGGSVARVANSGVIDVPQFASMGTIAAGGDPEKAFEVGSSIGSYLKEYGFNLDLAPVADVNTNPYNIVIGDRAFGSDPETASEFVSRAVDGFHDAGIMTCLKHFPGHGDTAEDSHFCTAAVSKTWEEMKQCELIPFIGSLDKTDMIMSAHIIAPEVTGDDTPASLSYTLLTEKLRNELGFEGLIITDSLGMGAVTKYYTSEESCVQAIKAGVDLLLKPAKAYSSYEAVMKAVEDGEISEERLSESVMRILRLKEKYGLIDL